MSYRSDAEKLQIFLNAIQEMASVAFMLAEQEGEISKVREYLEYVALSGQYAENYEDWKSSSYLDPEDSWNSSSCY